MADFKKYKAVSPEDTINSIRNILHGLGIFLKEIPSEKDGLYACRLIINNHKISPLRIGANGKGRSYEYALASGYAEFMERIQNGILYSITSLKYAKKDFINLVDNCSSFKQTVLREQLEIEFLYDPEEEYWDVAKVVSEYEKEVRRLFHLSDKENVLTFLNNILTDNKIIMVPFYSCNKGKKVMFPLSLALLATGSNGMCAGNIPKEAILQGLCEIFERYAASEIYFKHYTPPTIDIESFRDTIAYNKMQVLMKTRGYEFCIKDCSLGRGLPVIGLIIINRKSNTYNFKLGADFVPSIALERCLTEVYQSKGGFIGIPLLTKKVQCVENKIDNYVEYVKIVKNGTGQWPDSIFGSDYSYNFEGFDTEAGLSNDIDLKKGINLIKSLGGNLYIRDNSYLGLPTYYMVAPGLSEVYKDPFYFLDIVEKPSFDIASEILLKKCAFEQLLTPLMNKVVTSFKKNKKFDCNDLWPFYKSKELDDLDASLFVCMGYYMQKKYEESLKWLNSFLDNKGGEYVYYYGAADYIRFKCIELKPMENVFTFLKNKYGESIAVEICADLGNPLDVFNYYNFIDHIKNATIFENRNSGFMEVLRIHKILSLARKKRNIDQQNMADIMDCNE